MNPYPEGRALVIPRGDLLCWKFIDLLKSQITNKFQFKHEIRISKSETNSKFECLNTLNHQDGFQY